MRYHPHLGKARVCYREQRLAEDADGLCGTKRTGGLQGKRRRWLAEHTLEGCVAPI